MSTKKAEDLIDKRLLAVRRGLTRILNEDETRQIPFQEAMKISLGILKSDLKFLKEMQTELKNVRSKKNKKKRK